MEFLSWPWAEGFFGDDTRKFRYAHLAGALTFIPYGTMVDHFQHVIYEYPEFGSKERHMVWQELMGLYMPWVRPDDIPFYGEGKAWQRQAHIYKRPFYYIDYCLAEAVSLQIWAMIQEDVDAAWKTYLKYTELGGSMVFTDLLAEAGLRSPFDPESLRSIAKSVKAYLDTFDMTEIDG
jgi:oligoendopeptidase F